MSTDTQGLEAMLGQLRLSSLRDRLDNLLDEAAKKEMNLREALHFLMTIELTNKTDKRVRMGQTMARFPYQKSLEQYDYAAQPSVDPNRCASSPPAASWPTPRTSSYLGRQGSARRTWQSRSVARRLRPGTRCSSPQRKR